MITFQSCESCGGESATGQRCHACEPHRIRWYVYAGSELIPHTASMRGQWGYEAVCSCGWRSMTGGAVRSYIQREIQDHKWNVAS